MSDEVWKTIPGFPDYQVSNTGFVKSLKFGRNRILKPSTHDRRYAGVALNSKKRFRIHRLVMLAFVGPCPSGQEVCHKDGNPANNHLDNLRYGTHRENMYDAVLHGRITPTVVSNPKPFSFEYEYRRARIVREIYARGGVSYPALAVRYGMTVSGISRIVNGNRCFEAGGPIKGRDY